MLPDRIDAGIVIKNTPDFCQTVQRPATHAHSLRRRCNDSNTVEVSPAANGEVILDDDGCRGVFGRMDFGDIKVDSICLFGNKNKQRIRIASKPAVIFNEISGPDSYLLP